MNIGLWIARKNYLCMLVRKVSDYFGGDDIEFLRENCKELIRLHQDERIEAPIRCYEEIMHVVKYEPIRVRATIPDNKEVLKWELVPPFIPYTDELKEK
jgi:hypothetical protein